MSRRIRGSSALNGSSRNITSGFTASARARPDALLHAARELVRVAPGMAAEAHQVDHLEGPGVPRLASLAANLQPERNVVDAPAGGAAARSAGRPC